jgi:hypothetical protein
MTGLKSVPSFVKKYLKELILYSYLLMVFVGLHHDGTTVKVAMFECVVHGGPFCKQFLDQFLDVVKFLLTQVILTA